MRCHLLSAEGSLRFETSAPPSSIRAGSMPAISTLKVAMPCRSLRSGQAGWIWPGSARSR